jgi:hypothetical protein
VIGIVALVLLVGLTSMAMRRKPDLVGLALPAATLTIGTFVLLTAMRERYMVASLPLFLLVGVGWESGRIDRAALVAFVVVTVTHTVNLLGVASFAPELWTNIFGTAAQGPQGLPMKLLGYGCAVANVLVLIWAANRMWRSAQSSNVRVEGNVPAEPPPLGSSVESC